MNKTLVQSNGEAPGTDFLRPLAAEVVTFTLSWEHDCCLSCTIPGQILRVLHTCYEGKSK